MPRLPNPLAGQRPALRATAVSSPGRVGRGVQRAADVQSYYAGKPGREITKAAGSLLQIDEINQRIQARDAAVDRAKKITDFNTGAVDSLREIQTTGDLSDQDTITAYRDSLQSAKDQLLADHQFSADSQAKLNIRLEGIIGTHMTEATGLSLEAKKQAVDDTLGTFANSITESVYGNPSPENILEQFEAANSFVSDMEMNPADTFAWRRTIESKLVESAVTSFIDRGSVDGAEQVLMQTGVRDILDSDTRIKLVSRIGAARAARDKRRSESQRPFVIDGRLVSAKGDVLYDGTGDAPRDDFGNSLTGNELEAFTALTPKFEAGETTEEEDRVYLAAVSDYTQEKRDPETGLMQQKKVPAFVADALQRRGYGSVLEPAEPEITRNAYQALNKKTVWEIADEGNLTGPIPVAGRFIGRIPGLGGPAPGMTTAESYVNVIKRDLIRTLQNNPKFADAERKAIEKDVDIGSAFFDDKEAYKQRVVGVADALERRLDSMNKVASSSTTSRDERRWARNGINAIENFLEALLPPRVTTDEEAEDFIKNNPPGTPVLVKDGETWLEMEVPQ